MERRINRIKYTSPAKLTGLILICTFLTAFYPLQAASAQTATSTMVFEPFSSFEPYADASKGDYGYTPNQIKTAYNLPTTGGAGVTIAIIIAYDTPNIKQYLKTFSENFSLPLPDDSNFEVHKMSDSITYDAAWSTEACLNIEWAHAIAPQAKILLVEATDAYPEQILAAIDYVKTRSDVVAASMSYGIGESSDTLSWDAHLEGTDIVFFAATGNTPGEVSWPASSPYVVAVGGTVLTLNSDGSVASEVACSTSSSGTSSNEPMPSYQSSYGLTGSYRQVPDVSYCTGKTKGYPIYNGAWTSTTGTSAGAPQWAAIYALGLSASNENLYLSAKTSYAVHLRDITVGSNAYAAAAGYDLATGLGSPITTSFGTPVILATPEGSEIGLLAAVISAALFVGFVKKKKN